MKNFALKYPSSTVLLTFLIISIGGSLLGFISGLLIMWRNPCSDPCDGAAMAAVMIWRLSLMASIVIGGIGSVLVFVILQKMVKQQERN